MQPVIDVVLAADRYYYAQLAVTLRSLFEHNRRHRFRVSVFTDGHYPALQGRLRASVGEFSHEIGFHVLDLSRIGALSTLQHLPHATYFRLAIPDILPSAVTRVLYLDTDILVQGDIGPLWRTELGDAVHAAAADHLFDAHEKLQIPPDAAYFNAGVMVIDLDAWRRQRIAEQALAIVEHEFHRLSWCDQCALNAVTIGRWREVDGAFNAQRIHFYLPERTAAGLRFTPRLNADPDVTIAHFTGDQKPWDAGSDHPLRDRWFAVLDRTDWAGERPFSAEITWEELALRGPLWLFGAGGLARMAKQRLDRIPGARVAGVMDNFKNGSFADLPIRRIDQLSAAELASQPIVIASQFWQRIRQQLIVAGARSLFGAYPFDDSTLRQLTPEPAAVASRAA